MEAQSVIVFDKLPQMIAIKSYEDGRTLATLDIIGGRLIATYNLTDLNEAAIIFIDELRRIWNV